MKKKKVFFWYSTSEKQEVTFEFRYPIMMTSYTFQNAAEVVTHTYPKEWKIQGYNLDNQNWEDINYQNNQKFCESLYACSERVEKSYSVENPKNIYKTIKVLNLENSYKEKYDYLILSAIEFFGTMKISNTCKSSNYPFLFLKSFTMVLICFI